jgi:mannose-6-phosphate isomerase-like protein (cupin superfamily)
VAQNTNALVWKAADRLADGIISDSGLEKLGVAAVCLAPGEMSEGHSHTGVEEINIFRAGTGQIQIENDVFEVCGGMVAVVPAGRFHEVLNTGTESLEYVAVFDSEIDRPDVLLRSKEEHFDPSVPRYFKMLNTIAANAAAAAKAFRSWTEKTSSSELAEALSVIATRGTEHATAFEKRLLELERTPNLAAVDPFIVGLLAYLASDASDVEKLERLQLVVGADQLAGLFADTSIDPATGALLGRYVAEQRDSGRLLQQAHDRLVRAAQPDESEERTQHPATPVPDADIHALREDLDSLTAMVCQLKEALEQRSSA